MINKAFLTGDAMRKDKDEREKTSGLVDIGLITEAGRKLLKITSNGDLTMEIGRASCRERV